MSASDWSDAGWADDPQHWLRVRAERGETDAAAAFMILRQPQFADRVAPYIGVASNEGTIRFVGLLSAGWSTSEHAMLELAAHLWNSGAFPTIDLDYLLRALGEEWLAVALAAMAARHGAPLPIGSQS